jgi:hypothetical protein
VELRAAKVWGLTPRAWREQSQDGRAPMLAYEMWVQTRDTYRDEWRENQ